MCDGDVDACMPALNFVTDILLKIKCVKNLITS